MLDVVPFVNLHPSALPRWRGAAPVERSLMAGERRVRSRRCCSSRSSTPGRWRRWSTSTSGPTRTPERSTSARSRSGSRRSSRRSPTPAPAVSRPCRRSARPTYAEKLTAADRILDPARPARELHDRVRALSPHIGARLALDGTPHTVWRTAVRAEGPAPGTLALDEGALVLGCANGALELCDVQPPGGRRMASADWLRGLRGALPAVTSA